MSDGHAVVCNMCGRIAKILILLYYEIVWFIVGHHKDDVVLTQNVNTILSYLHLRRRL